MAFDFEGLSKPKTNAAQGNIKNELPSGVKPFNPEAKKESMFPSIPDTVKDAASLFTTVPMIVNAGEAVADTAKQTNAYKKYMYSDEEKLAEAKKISIETGIAENVLIASDDNLAKGREMFNFRRKQMALAPQGMNDFDIQQIYDAYPALGELKDDTEMAIGFSHIENIKQTKGIVEAAKQGLENAKLMREYSAIGNKAVYGGTLTDDDWKKAQEIEVKLKEAKFFPDFGDSPLANVIGNTAQQVYRYGPSVGKGIAAGAALGTVGGVAGSAGGVPGAVAGAKYGFGLGMKIGTMADMFDEVAGSRFMEYASLKDKQGKRLLSDADARLFTIVSAGVETGVEFWNYNSIMNLLGGSIHRQAIKDIVANAAGSNEAVKAGILNYAKGVAKVSGQVFAEELPEEAVQDVAEKGMWNFITGTYATNNNYKQYSGKEMLDSAGNAMLEAAPSVAGFSIMAGAGSTVSGVRSFARMAAIRKTYTDNEIQVANGVDMVSQLQDNKAENDLYKKQPDIYEKVLHNELDGTVYAQTRIDTELALADEETAKVFYQLAQEAGFEQEEINAIVENGADLVLPTELYTSKVDSGSKMNTFIKFGEGTESIARQKQMKELYQRELEGFMDKEEGKQADLIDTLIATAFPNSGPEQDLGAEIILSYPSDPANGWKAERNSAQNNIDNRLEPIYSRLREGMKQGVRLVEYGENGQKLRVSKNDVWYSDFYKANKRPPNKQELQDIAIDIYNGNGAKYGFTDWEANTAELADAFKSNADELHTELDRVNLLDSIKPNLISLSRAELGVMKGLSKEAVKVYQTVSKLADTATSKKARQSVKTTAILLARHADRIAEIARQSGMKDFTAEDYFSRMKFDFSGQGESLFKGGETVNQAGKNERIALDADGNEIETLNGTPIMMDENGYITMYHRTSVENAKEIEENGFKKGKENTGEVFLSTKSDGQIIGYGDTVVTVKVPANKVRIDDAFNDEVHAAVSHKYLKVVKPFDITKTPAFIKWFKNSKVVDKNGKPIILYHGTPVGDLTEFKKGLIYLSPNKEIADMYQSPNASSISFGKKVTTPATLAVYAKIEKPFDTRNAKDRKIFLNEFLGKDGGYDENGDETEHSWGSNGTNLTDKGLPDWTDVEDLHHFLKDKGYDYDGIIADEGGMGGYGEDVIDRGLSYVAFDSTQIKSVDNAGTFDENNANIYYQSAFHGSPNIFDRFSAERIGTGEGNQAHGWGLYFAKDKNVADEYYRYELSNNDNIIIYDGNRFEQVNYTWALSDGSEDNGDVETYIALAFDAYNESDNIEDAINVLEEQVKDNKYDDGDVVSETLDDDLKSAIEFITNAQGNIRRAEGGVTFEVEIPDNDVLLEENTLFDAQPIKIQKALEQILKDEAAGEEFAKAMDNKKSLSGDDFYNAISADLYSDAKEASMLLNKYGVEGIRYFGGRDGEAFVIFNDEAIQILNTYWQQNQDIHGSTTFLQSGERIIRLFETADQSTLAHELGHNFLADILYWGKLKTAPAWLKADYDTVCKYINYDGISEVTTEQHEKFARGFEAYLRNGEAPIKGLRGVFRKFKKWLTGLYKDFIDLGGLPSAEVRAVMDRMLVSEQEVEDEAKLQQYENGLKAIGKIVSTSDAQMYARWQNEAKEEAKEKTLAVAMKEVTDSLPKQRTDEIAQYEKDIREQLSEQDVFRVEAILKNNNDLTLLPALGYTEESYKDALAKAGGGLEQAVQKAVADFTKDYDSAPMSKEAIREQAERAMRDGNYNDMLVGFELEAMRAKAEEGNIANDKAVKKIEEIIAAMNGEEVSKETDEPAKVKSLKQKIADLRYSFRWTQAEERLIQENKLAELKKQIKDKKTQVRVLKSRVQASVTWTKDIAQDRLKRLRLSEVMSTRMWINLAKKSSQNALTAIKKEQWNDALKYKQQQLMYTIMASESTKIKDKVNKIVARQQKRSANMVQGKTKMPVNERYYFNHLLYVFGINKRDALEPVDGAESFLSLVKRFADNYEANFTDEDGNIGLPNWVLTAIGGKEVYGSRTENPLYADVKSQKKHAIGYEALKLQDFLAINDLLSTIYTVGRNADKLRTIKTADGKVISLKDVVDDLVLSITANVAVESNKDLTGATKKGKIESALEKGNDILLDLVKMETIFDQIDGGHEHGPAMTYLYNIANEARNHEKRMQIEATNKMKELFKPYSAKETRAMMNDKKYKFGTSILTKEQVIVLALNSGTELNKKRILDGYKVSEEGLMETLSNLEEKDWTLIHGIWRLFNSYWEETVGVEERMNGVGLVKQEAVPFTINGKDGNVYKVTGGYYPIKYDPTKSVKAAEQQEDDIAKQMHNDNAVFGTRIGFTKERNKTAKITRPVLLTFDVIPTALDNVIHNISHREMVRDINRIVTNKDFQDSVVNHFGINTYRAMKQWVRDNWAQEKKFSRLDKVASYLRRNMTGAVLGWRTTTALLNILNIFPMSEYLGVMSASKAVKDFYLNPVANTRFIMNKAVFMADRVNTMDRDMREVTKNLEGKANPIIRFAKNESFRLIAETDLILAKPLWLAEYKRVFQEGVAKGQDVETIERNAVAAGDKAVRRIFGSGEIHDLAPVQKGNELEKMLTMFYSYFNVVYNALSRKNRTGSRYDLARSFLYWIVLTSIGESLIRGATNGDDEDKLLKKMGKNLVSQSLGMVPVARDVFVGTLDLMFNDKSYGGAKVSSIYDGFTRFTTAAKTGYKLANDEGNKDWLDLMQESVKASNAFTGVSDTATDALFTTMRYIETDFDAEIGEYLKAVVFDKKLEK